MSRPWISSRWGTGTGTTARAPDQSGQKFFGLTHDATVFEIFRTAFDQAGKPIRVTVTVCPADRNQSIINVGVLPRTPSTTCLAPENQVDREEPGKEGS